MLALFSSLAPAIPTIPATPEGAVDFTWLFIKMILALVIIITLAMLGLKYGLPRLGVLRGLPQGRLFTILGRQGIEPRKSLALAKIASRYFVIGIADHAITPIAELTASEAEEAMRNIP